MVEEPDAEGLDAPAEEEGGPVKSFLEHLEDLRELNEAIARNKGKRLIPWEEAKKGLGLEV